MSNTTAPEEGTEKEESERLDSYPWKTMDAPKDRGIWIRANVITKDDCTTSAEPYEGFAQWNEKSQDWLDAGGMSIRQYFDAEILILGWIECTERAAGCPEEEKAYYFRVRWQGADWMTPERTGWYLICEVSHTPTRYMEIAQLQKGPFPRPREATACALAAFAEMEGSL